MGDTKTLLNFTHGTFLLISMFLGILTIPKLGECVGRGGCGLRVCGNIHAYAKFGENRTNRSG